MLKRIKIRGKLLLLLTTPLIAVTVFAYSGIVDRTDRTAFQEEEVRIAEVANAGSDLSLAIQVERLGVLEVERMMLVTDSLDAERAETNHHLNHWLMASNAALGDIDDPELVRSLEELIERLPTTLSPDRGADVVTGTLLASASRSVDEVTLRLADEAHDLDLFRDLTNLNSLIVMQSSYATITSIGSEAIFEGELSAVAATLINEAENQARISTNAFVASADQEYVTELEGLVSADVLPSTTQSRGATYIDIQNFIQDSSRGGVAAWLALGEARLTSLNDLIGSVITDASLAAQGEADQANQEAQSFLILAGSVVLIALMMAIIIGRSISRPLTQLTRNAEQLSAEELPALVESMRSAGRAEAPVVTPIEAKGRDEVAQLARAISEIQQVTIDVAEEQGDLLRRGISDIFVNLARRNQSLLDRQIDFIDQLESREENPDQLENLFRLDHLATRMRRNAESLLVLAGAEPARRRGRPVEIVDVLRVAMGEIEDFGRIELMAVEPSTVAGSVAVDLAHLMSELMENATQFSPPDAEVEVVGYRIEDDNYQLTLADRGIGMSAAQIATANTTFAEPPLVGLDLSRSLGFTVVSRLAHRLGVTVQLTSGSDGGVTAVITIPAEMIGALNEATNVSPAADDHVLAEMKDAPPAPVVPEIPAFSDLAAREPTAANPFGAETPTLDPTPQPPIEAAPIPEPMPAPDLAEATESLAKLPTRRPAKPPADAAAPTPAPATEPALKADDSDLFAAFGTPAGVPVAPSDPDVDLFAPIHSGEPLPTRTPPADEPVPPAAESPVSPPAPVRAEVAAPTPAAAPTDPIPTRDPAAVGAVSPQVTSAGLIRRTPKKVDVPEASKHAAPPPTAEPAAPIANRSPEEVRQMLSRYRAGLRKGRAPESDSNEPNRRS